MARAEVDRLRHDFEEFVHITAHDLKEPFRTISFQTSFILEDHKAALPAEAITRLETLQRLAQRGMRLVDDLTRFARSAEVHISATPQNLAPIVSQAAAAVGTQLQSARVRIDIDPALPAVRCDATALGTAFTNLIVNAARFNTSEAKVVRIGTRPAAKPGTAEITVADNGIGIPANRRTDVFRIFRRLHRDEEFGPSTGVGLAIVKKIIEAHHGSVHIEENPGGGSVVVMTLPA